MYFDREMTAVSSILTSTFNIQIVDSENKDITNFGWTVPSDYYSEYVSSESARYIYISLDIKETLSGGDNAATVTVTYNFNSGLGKQSLIFRGVQRCKQRVFDQPDECECKAEFPILLPF